MKLHNITIHGPRSTESGCSVVYTLYYCFIPLLPCCLVLVIRWQPAVRFQRCVGLFSMLTLISAGRRAFSQSATRRSYESTIQNLLIHKDTKVLCQGFTGKTVSAAFV